MSNFIHDYGPIFLIAVVVCALFFAVRIAIIERRRRRIVNESWGKKRALREREDWFGEEGTWAPKDDTKPYPKGKSRRRTQ